MRTIFAPVALLIGAAGACRSQEARPAMTADLPAGVTMTLEAPARIAFGDSARLTVRVTNGGSAPATLYLRGREPTLDLLVTDEEGNEWRKLEQAVVEALLRLESLAPGQSLELRETWKPTRRGQFTVTALLLGEQLPYASAPRTISVE